MISASAINMKPWITRSRMTVIVFSVEKSAGAELVWHSGHTREPIPAPAIDYLQDSGESYAAFAKVSMFA